MRCKAVTRQNYLDDIELDEESIADIVMDENAVASMPRFLCLFVFELYKYVFRPGTSLNTPQVSGRGTTGFDQGVRPVSQSGRPVTGFSRPSSSRPMSGSTNVRDALQSSRRSGTARPMTTLGREMRLGTASLSSNSAGPMVDVERLNVQKYATRTGLAMAVTDYLLYVEHNTRKALELCAEATKAVSFLVI